MKNFTITYNRHENKYGPRLRNFPSEYAGGSPYIDYWNDPDWTQKIQPRRMNFLFLFTGIGLLVYMVHRRLHKVATFDALKRREQRAMQNREAEDVEGKLVNFCVFEYSKKKEYEKITRASLTQGRPQYVIFWYDAKMKNYLSLLEYMQKRGRSVSSQHQVTSYLVVDKAEYAENVADIADAAEDKRLKKLVRVALKRPLTEQESLILSFDESQAVGDDEEVIDLDMKKNFFYIINPDGKIIDCAKIYSFMHEDNIYQRIIARILKDVDERNTGQKTII